jgi:peptidylprolyl isomerase
VPIPENRRTEGRDVKLKTLAAAAAAAVLAACSGDGPTAVEIDPPPPLPAGATIVTTASGLQYADITVGTGTVAQNGRAVSVHYTGWLENGTGFDTSVGGQPFQFVPGQSAVIPGFQEGVVGMRVGGKRRLFIPPALGYGDVPQTDSNGNVVIPANSTLIFDVQLVGAQ